MKYFISILTLLTLLNCQKVDKNNIPDQLLSEEQLTLILIDIAEIKAVKDRYLYELKSTGILPNDFLCNKHDIDSITLNENLAYYSYTPEKLKEVYTKVLDSLNKSHLQIEGFIEKRKEDLQKKHLEREQCTKDSIQRVTRLNSIKKMTKKTVKKLKKTKDTLKVG